MKKFFPAILAVLLFLSACDIPQDPFENLRGVNLISSQDFASGEWIKEQTDVHYMVFEEASAQAGTTEGLLAGAEIYRLEIPNLMPNGDFEEALAGWTATGGAAMSWQNTGHIINGYSLSYSFPSTDRIYFDLSIISGLIENNTYALQFDFNTDVSTINSYFEYNNNTSLYNKWSLSSQTVEWAVCRFPDADSPQFTARSGTSHYFSIGKIDGDNSQTGHIDNIRIARTDISNYLFLYVPYSDPAGVRPDMVSGTYKFSVYVKKEDTANITPVTDNAFDSTGFTLRAKTAVMDHSEAVDISEITRSEWVKIETNVFIQINPPEPEEEDQTVITLYITPNNALFDRTKDAGRILISSPGLEFLPDEPETEEE